MKEEVPFGEIPLEDFLLLLLMLKRIGCRSITQKNSKLKENSSPCVYIHAESNPERE